MDNKKELDIKEDQEQRLRAKLWTPECDKLLRRWKKQVATRQRIHNDMARKYKQRHYYLGIPGIILGMIVASGTFSTFSNCDTCTNNSTSFISCEANEWVRLAMGIIGVISSIDAGLMTFLDYQSQAEDHKSASDEYDSMYRQLDTILLLPGYARGDVVCTLQSLRSQYDSIAKRSPTLPKKYDIELTYEVAKSQGPPPPPPNFIPDGNESNFIKEAKLTSRIRLHLDEITKNDTTDNNINQPTKPKQKMCNTSDEEVCINFDPDDPEDRGNAPISSLQAALAFEMGRMEG